MTIIEVPEGFGWEIEKKKVRTFSDDGFYTERYETRYFLYYFGREFKRNSYTEKVTILKEYPKPRFFWQTWKKAEVEIERVYDVFRPKLGSVKLPEVFAKEDIISAAWGILHDLASAENLDRFIGKYPPKELV